MTVAQEMPNLSILDMICTLTIDYSHVSQGQWVNIQNIDEQSGKIGQEVPGGMYTCKGPIDVKQLSFYEGTQLVQVMYLQ